MQYSFGTTAVSSQIGCSMGCAFCASGEGAWCDLSWSEMADQILAIQEDSNTKSEELLLGSGEPLLNFDS